MSNFRIALVAEGPTDYVVLEAALQAILPQPFVLTLLQPEATNPQMGTGWCGVLKWCSDRAQRRGNLVEIDPTLVGFDLVIMHLDVDVATATYSDCGQSLPSIALTHGWAALPCAQTCPPVAATVAPLTAVVHSWLAPCLVGPKTVLC